MYVRLLASLPVSPAMVSNSSMEVKDAPRLAVLSKQLGYAITAERVAEKFHILNTKHDNGFFVIERSQVVIGWVHIYGVHLLESEPYAEIGGLWLRKAPGG